LRGVPRHAAHRTSIAARSLLSYGLPALSGPDRPLAACFGNRTGDRIVSDLKDPRVLFAAERTLLAWNRTSLALIAFGFVLERAAILIELLSPDSAAAGTSGASFWLGLAFIALGVFAAAWSSKQYLTLLETLSPAEFPPGYGTRWGVAVNVIVALLGAGLMVALFIAA
jgi:putative membrane protein